MSSRRNTWIDRRGQYGAEAAIDQVIERLVQPDEQVQQIADELIEDSPYQARQTYTSESVEELAQGMREVGFQGVLIVRPHSEPAKRRHGIVQLVYGHRRRIAWRKICADRGAPCLVPVAIREISDAQLLTIGAQENLQRQDLDPVEEAQIIAWHERMFFEKNQADIGAMLGKSSDWVSVRSRIYKLPEALKERLRQRPRAIGQILELTRLYEQHPIRALALADRVVQDNLTVAALRALVRDSHQEQRTTPAIRENEHNRRVGATSVQHITNSEPASPQATTVSSNTYDYDPVAKHSGEKDLPPSQLLLRSSLASQSQNFDTPGNDMPSHSSDLLLLQQAVAMLGDVASRADALPDDSKIEQAIAHAEQSLRLLREARASHC